MDGLQLLGWAGTLGVLSFYALSIRRDKPHWFHAANAVGAVAIVISALPLHAWPQITLTGAFGIIGAWGYIGWWRHRHDRDPDDPRSERSNRTGRFE